MASSLCPEGESLLDLERAPVNRVNLSLALEKPTAAEIALSRPTGREGARAVARAIGDGCRGRRLCRLPPAAAKPGAIQVW